MHKKTHLLSCPLTPHLQREGVSPTAGRHSTVPLQHGFERISVNEEHIENTQDVERGSITEKCSSSQIMYLPPENALPFRSAAIRSGSHGTNSLSTSESFHCLTLKLSK